MELNNESFELGNKRSIIREIFEFGKKRSSEIGKENVFDFSLGNPSVKPPKKVSDTLFDLLKSEDSVLLHGYTSAQGDLGVREAIANHINKEFNVEINANNIYMTCGAAASLTISLKAILNPNEEVIVFAPFFTEYRVFIKNAGGKVVVSNPNPIDFQIDFKDLESKINEKTRAVIINSPNNPSGVVYNEKTIIALTDLLKEKEKKYEKTIYLISDEPYRELVYGNVKVPYIMNYYSDSIVCYSYSKSLSLPGERIGYIAVSPTLNDGKNVYLAICGAGRSLGYVCAPSLFQQVIKKCVDEKVDISVYEKNRNLIYDSLTKMGYSCVKPDGAFYLFVKSLEKDALKFSIRARDYELLIVPCDDFGVDGYVRIAYCVDYDKIKKSLDSFQKLFDSYKN